MNAAALLREIVAIPSPSGSEERVRDLVAAALRAEGTEPIVSGRNVWASAGPEDAPALLLCTHLDTVRAGSGWTRDPHDPGDDADRVWGLGANDAGGCAVGLLHAFVSLARDGDLPARLVLALVCDEETGGEGIEALRAELPPLAAAVIGEPTELRVATAQRGLVRFEVTWRGRTAHASRPWQGENAIERALPDLARLVAVSFEDVHPLLGRATLQVTNLAAGTGSTNVIPDRCVASGDARPSPLHPNEEVVAAIRTAVRDGEITKMRARMTPVETARDEPIVAAALEATGADDPVGFGGVSDLFHVRDVPGVVVGPGAPERSHAPDEWIGVDEIAAGAATYRRIAQAWMRRRADADR